MQWITSLGTLTLGVNVGLIALNTWNLYRVQRTRRHLKQALAEINASSKFLDGLTTALQRRLKELGQPHEMISWGPDDSAH